METFIVKITDKGSLDLIQIYNYIAYELKVPDTTYQKKNHHLFTNDYYF